MAHQLTPEQQQLYQDLQEQMRADGSREQSTHTADAQGCMRTEGKQARPRLTELPCALAPRCVRLKAVLKARLQQVGWQKELTTHCQSVLTSRGLQQVTIDELIDATQQKAEQAIPETIREELQQVRWRRMCTHASCVCCSHGSRSSLDRLCFPRSKFAKRSSSRPRRS
jgi:hypothetical protein